MRCPTQKRRKKNPLPPIADDIAMEVLARLPTRVLQKFRLVQNSWNSLISRDDYFANLHLKTPSNLKKKTNSWIDLSRPNYRVHNWFLNYRSDSNTKIYKFDFSKFPQEYVMTNSCNGLVGVHGPDGSFYIINPSIAKIAPLRGCTIHVKGRYPMYQTPLAAIGFVKSTGEYKVVRLFVREYQGFEPVSIGCEVFSLGVDNNRRWQSWKPVEDPPQVYFFHECVCYRFPALVNEVIYWTVDFQMVKIPNGIGFDQICKPEVALSFDLKKEKFGLVLHPQGTSRTEAASIAALNERLCIVDKLGKDEIIIWRLEEESKWEKIFCIDPTTICCIDPTRFSVSKRALVPLKIEDGKYVFFYNCGYENCLLYNDEITKKFVMKREINRFTRFISPYTESLIWPWPKHCN